MTPPRILVVDDDAALRDIVHEALSVAGYATVAVGTGPEALAAARAHPPALILLDHKLPGMDGPAVLAALQADPQLRTIPVLLLTGSLVDLPELPGVAATLRKPFALQNLEAAVRALLAAGRGA